MRKKYNYKQKYQEKNSHITQRKCKSCDKFTSVENLETSYMCKTCYVKVNAQKRCSKCGLLKCVSQFHKNPNYKDGYLNKCIDCRKQVETLEKQRMYSKKHYKKREIS